MTQPIFMVGARGAGKTTVGSALANALGYKFSDTDLHLLRTSGLSVADIVDREGWQGFRRRETETLKTISSGLASASLMGLLLWWMTPFNWWQAPLIALLIAIVGMLGNLVMAAIKRDRGINSWGDTIVGYGSMLDKLESAIFAAPIYFHIVHAFWTK